MRKRGRFALNAASSYGVRVLLGLSALVLTPYIYRRLGGDGFGTWSVMLTLVTVASLIEYGFATGISKFVAEHTGRDDRQALRSTLRASVTMMSIVGVLVAGLTVAAGFLLDGPAASQYQDDFRHGMFVIAGALLLRFPCAAYLGALEGKQRFDLANLSWAVVTVLFSVGTVISIETGSA